MYIEADLLYAYLKPTDWLKKYAVEILERLKFKFKTSIITIIELEIVSKRDFGGDFANSVLENLEKLKNLELVPLGIEVSRKAVELRKEFGLNIFDAVHAASALLLKEDIISSDRIFDTIDGIKRIDPIEIVSTAGSFDKTDKN